MDELSFHRATEADTTVIAPMLREFYEYFSDIEYDDVQSPTALRELLEDDSLGTLFLLRLGAEPIGYLALTYGFSLEFRGRYAFLDEFYIRPPYRARGYGKRALAFAGDACRAAGVRALFLEVDRDNADGQRLYRGAGFAPREHYHLFYKRVEENAP